MTTSVSDTAEPTAFTSAGKGKRSHNTPSLYLSQDRPDNAKCPRIDNTPTLGSSAVSNTSPGKGKSWQSLNNSNFLENRDARS